MRKRHRIIKKKTVFQENYKELADGYKKDLKLLMDCDTLEDVKSTRFNAWDLDYEIPAHMKR